MKNNTVAQGTPSASTPPSARLIVKSRFLLVLAKCRLKLFYLLVRARDRNLPKIVAAMAFLAIVVIAAILWKHWSALSEYLLSSAPGETRQLAVAIGVAITGLLAIVFSLTLFTVQQAADKGTAAIFEEFARDIWLWTIYWLLALFAIGSFLIALLPKSHSFLSAEATCEFALITLTFVILSFHFRRAVRLVNARGMINRFHQRGVKQLRSIERLERDLVRAQVIQRRVHPKNDVTRA